MTLTNKYPAFPFHGVNFSKTTLTTLLPERKDRFGGPGRNRTDVQGFAILCITTLLPGQLVFCFVCKSQPPCKNKSIYRIYLY